MLNELRNTRVLAMAVALVGLAWGPAALAAKADAGPMATVRNFLDNFNKGDVDAAAATHADDVTIIDEFAPHAWRGPGAFKTWAGDLMKHDSAAGLSGEKVTIRKADVVTESGDDAYVVASVVYTYKEKGKAMMEPAHMALSLHKTDGAWKITNWAWAGTVPQKVAAKSAAAPAASAAPAPAAVPAPKKP